MQHGRKPESAAAADSITVAHEIKTEGQTCESLGQHGPQTCYTTPLGDSSDT